MLTFDLFTARSNLLPHAFVWALYIHIGKMLRIHILDVFSIIQLNRNLMMSIWTLMRHKIAKWADRISKMATTAAILKINFRHLFSNLRSLVETCSLAQQDDFWIETSYNCVDRKSKMASMVLLHWTRWPLELKKLENLQTTSRPWPMAWFQNICTEVFHQRPSTKITKMALLGWTKWWPELKIEKPLKDISSTASVLIPK